MFCMENEYTEANATQVGKNKILSFREINFLSFY